MAVIQDLMVGGDGLVRAATIRTATGITSRPITRLYPLELSLDNQSKEPREHPTVSVWQPSEPQPVDSAGENSRPQRASAKRATSRLKEWARVLAAPPEDVATKAIKIFLLQYISSDTSWHIIHTQIWQSPWLR